MSYIAAGTGTGNAFVQTSDTTGNLVFQTNGTTTALTLTTTQVANFANTVSATGNILTAGIISAAGTVNAPNTFGFKNRIINGAMGIWQRGTTTTSSVGYFTVDRWRNENCATFNQSSDVPTAAQAGTLFPYSLEYSSSSATFPYAQQRIESVNIADLAGQSATLSFWAKNVSGASVLYTEVYYANSKDNFSSVTLISQPVVSGSPSSSWTKYSGTFDLPAQAANGIELRIVRDNVAAATTRITGVQIEAGSQATSFDVRDYGRELLMCQRYYQKSYNQATAAGASVPDIRPYPNVDIPASISGQALTLYVYLKTTMRTAPTVVYYDRAGTSSKITGIASSTAQTDGVNLNDLQATDSGIQFRAYNIAYYGFGLNYTATAEL